MGQINQIKRHVGTFEENKLQVMATEQKLGGSSQLSLQYEDNKTNKCSLKKLIAVHVQVCCECKLMQGILILCFKTNNCALNKTVYCLQQEGCIFSAVCYLEKYLEKKKISKKFGGKPRISFPPCGFWT